jgi:hypothetical protein
MAVALLADPANPLPQERRDALSRAGHVGLEDLAKSAEPNRESWRDLTDLLNWMTAARELGLIDDPDDVIQRGNDALVECADLHKKHGKLRLSAQGMADLATLMAQFDALIGQVSARLYWSITKRAGVRCRDIWTGKRKAGDVVVSL